MLKHIMCSINIFDDLNVDFFKSKEKLVIFKELEQGDKILKQDETYYVQKKNILQPIKRWWYKENRENVVTYLDEMFKPFIGFLDRVLDVSKRILEEPDFLEINSLKYNCHEFINETIPGLYTLKQTYENENDIVSKVDSIILTLLDFKKLCGIKLNVMVPPNRRIKSRSSSEL